MYLKLGPSLEPRVVPRHPRHHPWIRHWVCPVICLQRYINSLECNLLLAYSQISCLLVSRNHIHLYKLALLLFGSKLYLKMQVSTQVFLQHILQKVCQLQQPHLAELHCKKSYLKLTGHHLELFISIVSDHSHFQLFHRLFS